MIRNVIYQSSQEPREVFFRTLLFKTFNRIETWEYIRDRLGGEISFKDYSFNRYNRLLLHLLKQKKKIYSAAYIMASGKSVFGFERKHENHLKLIQQMVQKNLPEKITQAKNLKDIYELFLDCPTIGPFLAYQYATDIAYSELTDVNEMDFVMPGPGARDGIRKCFKDTGSYSEADLIRYMTDNQEKEFECLGLKFKTLWGRRLQLIDCQNLFCEVDKYARLKHPEIKGISGRTRIKQVYKPQNEPIQYWYPPKWKINHLVEKTLQNRQHPEPSNTQNLQFPLFSK